MRKVSTNEYKELPQAVGTERLTQIECDSDHTDTQLQKEAEKIERRLTRILQRNGK